MMQETTANCSPPEPPMAVSIPEAARLLSISKRQVYYLIQSGVIPSRKLGRRRLIPLAGLQRLMETPTP